MKYAILGGSFDPPHVGHLAIAHAVRDHLGLDEVIFVPANRNPLKNRSKASAQDRFAMVQLMLKGEEGLSLSDAETSRPGRSFTVDTIEEFAFAKPGEIWLVLGTDTLGGILEWKKPEKLVKLCRLAVAARPGAEIDKIMAPLPDWIKERVDIVPMKANRASSTLVREEIYKGVSPEMWLDPQVWEYISERGLYRKEAEGP